MCVCLSVFFLADAIHLLAIPGPAGAGPRHPTPDVSCKPCLPVFGMNQKLKIQSKSGPKKKKKKPSQKEMK